MFKTLWQFKRKTFKIFNLIFDCDPVVVAWLVRVSVSRSADCAFTQQTVDRSLLGAWYHLYKFMLVQLVHRPTL